jgi:hypothetical protein
MLRHCAVTLVLLPPALAQGAVWIVDAANGPGTHFTDLQAGLASPLVRDRDRLVVRAGSYGPCSTNKGVTILGEPGAVIATGSSPALSVTGLAPGKAFVLHRFGIAYFGAAEGIDLRDNQGHVHLSELTFSGTALESNALTAAACTLVSVHRCVGTGVSSSVHSAGTNLIMTESTVVGRLQLTSLFRTNTAGLTIEGGTAWLAQLTATGGAGIPQGRAAREPAPGLAAVGATVLLAGDCLVSAGQVGATTAVAGAIHLFRSTLSIGPTVRLAPFAGWPPIHAVTSTVLATALPYLTATSAPPAGTLVIEVVSAPYDLVFLAMGLPGPQVTLPIGPTWLDLRTLVPLAFVSQGFAGRFGVRLPVPNVAELRGLLLVLQSANAAWSSGRVELTNPVFVSLH